MGPPDLDRALSLGGGLPGLLFSLAAPTGPKRWVVARAVGWMGEGHLDRAILTAARSRRRRARR